MFEDATIMLKKLRAQHEKDIATIDELLHTLETLSITTQEQVEFPDVFEEKPKRRTRRVVPSNTEIMSAINTNGGGIRLD